MSLFLYNFFLALYSVSVRVAALFNPKAKKWVNGRRGWQMHLAKALATTAGRKRIWVHCASLGEFEQGRPLIEAIKQQYPNYAIVLTFFSPSGYEVRKNYPGADHVFYLPADGRRNARRFIDLVAPDQVVFVKYEFWYHYIHTLKLRNIPVILVSAAFRSDQVFFRWYGGFFRSLLKDFARIFVQDERSAQLLAGVGIREGVVVAGDTRYDRVSAIAAQAPSFPEMERFRGESKLVIAGSTWPADENILHESWKVFPEGWKLVIAPHEIDADHLSEIQRQFSHHIVLYSELVNGTGDPHQKVLLIDNIGMLSALYQYGEIAYVGGGFQPGGIHNILEPAVFGLPVLFGPNYEKFVEARGMVERHFGIPIKSTPQCKQALKQLFANPGQLRHVQIEIRAYVQQHTGATGTIMQAMQL